MAALVRSRGRPERPPRCTIDFETRSACELAGRKGRGAWLYSKHPSTQLLCLSYHLPGMDPKEPKLWHRAHPAIGIEESAPPEDLFAYIATGGKIEAHNAAFETYVWEHVAVPQHGWPEIYEDQWLCSAAKAAAHALPRALDGAISALNLAVKKDPRGEALLKKYSKPKKLTKAEREIFGDDELVWNEDVEGIEQIWSYNKQDVRAEMGLSNALPDLSPMEQNVWHITQKMNRRGVLIDVDLAKAALHLVARAKIKANAELREMTGIESATQRAVIKNWLANEELIQLPDTKAKTLEWILDRMELSPRCRRVIEIVKEVNRTSTNKYQRMLECVDEDNRARELLLYCGAERTGRFAGRGIQIHNLPKGKFVKGISIDEACAAIKSRDLQWCEFLDGKDDAMNLIASCLRGSIIAPPGRKLWTADYAAIEARCVLWESGATAALNVFFEGGDIYCDMASGIYGYQIVKDEKALAKNPEARIAQVINAMGSTQRDFGKVAVLGLGYGMGYIKFLITLRTYNIYLTRKDVLKMMGAARLAKYERIVHKKLFPSQADFTKDDGYDAKKHKAACREASMSKRRLTDEREDPEKIIHELALCKFTVDTYRSRYPEVPQMWKDQEAAAIQAVRLQGKPIEQRKIKCGVVTWYMKGRFLKCRLPSGRTLNYCDPEIKMAKTSWGESRPSLRFMGIDQKTKKWTRQSSYGGKLCIAEETDVLTEYGWVPIQEVRMQDRVWDGVEWVYHGGVAFNGIKEVISCDGMWMTPDHEVLTDRGWKYASSGNRYNRAAVSLPDRYALCGEQPRRIKVNRLLSTQARVFDLSNCGPRNRFVIRSADRTRCLIVHNCENITQAIARDVLASAKIELEAHPTYDLLISVHDEVVSEADDGEGDRGEFEALMSAMPACYKGCPISAEAKTYERYRK